MAKLSGAQLHFTEDSDAVFEQVQRCLKSRQAEEGDGGSRVTGAGLVSYSTENVLSSLTQMQVEVSVLAPLGDLLQLGLQQRLSQFPGEVIGKQEQDVIDLVEKVFDSIFEDEGLPKTLTPIMARLQVPTIKVAMQDVRFFSRPLK